MSEVARVDRAVHSTGARPLYPALLVRAAALGLVLVVAGCIQPAHHAGAKPDGFRLVTGSVNVPDAAQLGRQATGLQVAAIAIGTKENPGRVDVFASDVFDGSHPETATFTAPVDGTRSFVVILQVAAASANGEGTFLGALHFSDGRGGDTTLVPPGTTDFELGTLELQTGARTGENALLAGDANNPLSQIDTDGDGVFDLSDDDDDGDGVPDATDSDAGGDGVDDVKQLLQALPDVDGDGVPDELQG